MHLALLRAAALLLLIVPAVVPGPAVDRALEGPIDVDSDGVDDDTGPTDTEDPIAKPTMEHPEAVLAALYDSISFAPGEVIDWERFDGLFVEGARLHQPAEGERAATNVEVAEFAADFRGFLAATGCDEAGFTERLVHQRSEQYGGLAQAFVTFEARLGTWDAARVRRGVDAIQLVRTEDGWRITSLTTEWEQPDAPLDEGF